MEAESQEEKEEEEEGKGDFGYDDGRVRKL